MSAKSLSKLDQPKNITNNERVLGEDDFIVSKTNLQGKIIYCNEIFAEMAGYTFKQLIGANHNLIRHPDMPKIAFKILWDYVQKKKEYFGFVKNLCADGGYYWVFAYITPDVDLNGNITSYTSVRRKMSDSAKDTIIPLYQKLLEAERSGGLSASEKMLDDLLKEKNMSYNQLVISLQIGAKL